MVDPAQQIIHVHRSWKIAFLWLEAFTERTALTAMRRKSNYRVLRKQNAACSERCFMISLEIMKFEVLQFVICFFSILPLFAHWSLLNSWLKSRQVCGFRSNGTVFRCDSNDAWKENRLWKIRYEQIHVDQFVSFAAQYWGSGFICNHLNTSRRGWLFGPDSQTGQRR